MDQSYFMPYQIRWVTDPSKMLVVEKARRIGFTKAEAYWSVRRRLTTKADHIMSSKDEKTGREFLMYAKEFCQIINLSTGYPYIDLGASTSEVITFPNGSRIMLNSSNPGSFRGMGKGATDVTLDEFAHHENQDLLYAAAKPITDWGGVLRILSTHNGVGCMYYQIVQDAKKNKNKFKLHTVTLVDAVNQGLAEKQPGEHQLIADKEERHKAFIASRRAECLSENIFLQEYMASPMGEGTMITPESYDKCILKGYEVPKHHYEIDLDKAGPINVGIDVGRHHDCSVLTALEKGLDAKATDRTLQNVYRAVLCRTLRGMPFDQQLTIFSELIAHRSIRKVIIEVNGIGAGIGEQLYARFPDKVEQWTTTQKNKQEVCERVAGFIAQSRLVLPSEQEIKDDILSMKRISTPSGKTGYEGGTKTTHADHFMSLGFALAAAEGDQLSFNLLR